MAYLYWSLGGGKGPTCPRLVTGLNADVVEEDPSETMIFDLVKIAEYVDFPFSRPVAAEESGNTIDVDDDRGCWGRRGTRGDR